MLPASSVAQTGASYIIKTAAGNGTQGYSGDGGPATQAQLDFPFSVVVDPAGNVYIADSANGRIRKVSTDGRITTIVTSATSIGDLALDRSGNLYFVGDQQIRKLSTDGGLSTVAGNGTWGYSGDGGPATQAQLGTPGSIAADRDGNLYISDTGNVRIRRVAPNGTITTVAGNGNVGISGDGGPATQASIDTGPIAVDGAGNLYISNGPDQRIRKVTPDGVITTVVVNAQLVEIAALAIDGSGNFFAGSFYSHSILRVDATGASTVVAGYGSPGYSGDGGPARNAALNDPIGLAVTAAGLIYVADCWNNVVRVLVPQANVPSLSVAKTHQGTFTPGQMGAAYSVVLSNSASAGPTAGVVTVTDAIPVGLTLVSMAGNGWSCANNICSRSDALSPGSGYPPITVNVNVASSAPSQVTNQVTVTGGGSAAGSASDVAIVAPCNYSVAPASLQIPVSGGSFTVSIQTVASCSWTVSGLPSWITVSGASSGTGSATVSLTVAANTAAARSATISVAGVSVQVAQPSGTPSPSINVGGVVSAASYAAAVAPGSIAAVFGNFLVNSTTTASGTPWPATLAGLSMQFAGKYPAPLYLVSAGQVSLQVPWELAGQAQTALTVTMSGQTSAPQTANVVPFAPAIFTTNAQGSGQGAILENSSSRLVDSSFPAVAGSTYVQIYCTGLGAVTNQPASGSAAPSSPLSRTTTTPTVTIGGVSAVVAFSGLVPGTVGLYQVNVQVPAGSPTGSAVPVVISMGGATSNSVTMAVKAPAATGNLQIQVTGLPSGTAANVAITSTAGFSSVITASQNLQVAPGNYTVTANSVLVGNVYYGAFPVQQSVNVTAGSVNIVTVAYSIIIPATTIVLDQQGSQGLGVSADGTTVTLPVSSQTAQSLSPGSVLAVGSTAATPGGLLRKVVSVSQSGSQVVAQTTQATLADAFQQANFAASITLAPQNTHTLKPSLAGVTMRWVPRQQTTPRNTSQDSCSSDSSLLVEMFDAPVIEDSKGTITVSGEMQVCPSLDLEADFRGLPFPALTSLVATTTFAEDVHINITGSYGGSFDKQVSVGTLASDPITVLIAGVPIVLTPSLSFFVGVSGSANAGFSLGVTQSASVTGGFTYASGKLSKVSNSTNSFSQDPLALDATLSARGYAGFTIDLNIDGVLSPAFSPDAYLNMDVNVLNSPWWTLSAGLEGDASVKLSIWGLNLADFDDPSLFDVSKVIAQASGGFAPSSAAPVLANISPSTAFAGSVGLTLTLTGYNFVPGATAYFNGTPLSTTFVTTQQLTAVLPASSLSVAGIFAVAVTNPDTPGASSLVLSFTVQSVTAPNPQPTIANLSPNSAVAGTNPLPVTITGNGFLTSSTVTFNGIAHPASLGATGQLTITLTAADLRTAGNYPVVVTNPPPGGGSSQPATFTVQPAPVTPTLQSLTLSGATVVGGGSVTGTITLSGAAPTGGVQVLVSSGNPIAQVPTFVTVSSGQSSATFTITTTLVTSSQNVTISASLAGVTKTASLAVNAPTVTATVIYAGTDTGIYRSSDGGVTWQQSVAWPQASFTFVGGIVIDPLNSSNVYAAAVNYSTLGSVLLRSTDAGQTWAAVSAPSAGFLAIDAVSTNVLYLLGDGLYRSTDKGMTWSPTALAQVYGVTADPTLSGVVYASALSASSFLLYKSADFGATWTLLATNLNLPANNPGMTTSITVDPHNSNALYASGEGLCVPGSTATMCGLFKSTDGGNNWQNLGVQGQYSNVAIDYTTGVLYAGGTLAPYFGYVVKSSDGGKTWAPINTGLTTTGVGVFTDPGNSSNLFAVGQSSAVSYNGLFRSTNGGASWTFTQIVPAGGQFLSFGIPAR